MIVLDTTVLVYAVGTDHRLREPCRRLLRAVREGAVAATTTVEVLQEFVHVRSRRRTRADAVDLADAYLDLLSPLLTADEDSLVRAFGVYRDVDTVGAFDALLAAVAVGAGAQALVSADRAFSHVAGLNHVLADSGGVASLLGDP